MEDKTAAEEELVLAVQQRGRAATMSVSGELDAFTAPELADRFRSAYARGVREVVIDLSDTSFLDSSGLRALVGAMQLFGGGGGSVRLSHLSEPVERLLAITGLTEYFSSDGGGQA